MPSNAAPTQCATLAHQANVSTIWCSDPETFLAQSVHMMNPRGEKADTWELEPRQEVLHAQHSLQDEGVSETFACSWTQCNIIGSKWRVIGRNKRQRPVKLSPFRSHGQLGSFALWPVVCLCRWPALRVQHRFTKSLREYSCIGSVKLLVWHEPKATSYSCILSTNKGDYQRQSRVLEQAGWWGGGSKFLRSTNLEVTLVWGGVQDF